ncbi:MAG: multiheme c-type cytochrome [Rhodocyclaceae bacterium]
MTATAAKEDVAGFLARHWQRPLAAQGAAPAHFGPQEAALDPAACGACHVRQYEDWRTTWHARAMGPGVLGQLVDMAPEARDEHQDCIRCHAPLAEQADALVAAIAGKVKTGLHAEGLVCAACHVREHQRFGPPRRDGSVAKPEEKLPHDGWQASAAFADSRFCAACHQFEADGFALNGKLLENTYAEWQASPAAREGRTCQSCHMPDRRHLWRGVHDADMVKSGVAIEYEAPRLESGAVLARLTLANSGTGHHFPTYVTPRVVVELFQAGADGRELPGTRQEHVIARQVALDLSREIADTRIAPGAEARVDYRRPLHPRAVRLDTRVRVEPDAFYTDFYRALLASGAGRGEAMIRRALDDSLASHFVIHEQSQPLRDGAAKP